VEAGKPVSTDVYVKVKNNSAGTSLRFTKGNAILTPLNSGSGMLNAGESAVYKTEAGPVSHYSFKMNGVNDVSFPAGLVTFEAGMIYTFVFDGALLSWDGNPVPVSVQTCYEEDVITYTVTYDAGDGNGTPPAGQSVNAWPVIYLPGQGDMTVPAGKTFKRLGNRRTELRGQCRLHGERQHCIYGAVDCTRRGNLHCQL